MKFIDIINTAIGNSFRSKLRTTLTVVAIFIGAFTLTITSAIGTGVSSYIDAQVASIGADDVMTITKAADASAAADDGPAEYDPNKATTSGGFGGGAPPGLSMEALTDDDLESIAEADGIVEVNPMVRVSPDYIEYDGHGKYELSVNPSAALTSADLAAGSQLAGGGALEVLIPTSYLENLGFDSAKSAVGQTVAIGIADYVGDRQELEATVAGVQNETILGGGVGLSQGLTDELQDIGSRGKPAGVEEGYVAATAHFDADSTPSQVDAIKADLADRGFAALTVADQIGSFKAVIDGIIGVLNAFAVIALIAAGFGIINTLLMSVQERTREIGLMKAMGMSGSKVYLLFSAEAVFIGFLGSTIGAVVAIGVGSLISNALAGTLLSGLPGLQIMEFAPGAVAIIIGVVMLIAFLAGTLPARRAARQNPIDALRYE